MDDIESKFLETQSLQPLIWFRYIDDVFFIWTHGEGKASIIPCRSKQLQSSLNLHLSYNKYLHILYMDQETKNVFTPGPMATFCSARKLSSYLVRSKLYIIERIVGSHKCKGKRCKVCSNVQETSCFSSSLTNETYKTNHQFECNKKCLVCLLACKKCLKQYVGQTTDLFRHCWDNYKSNDRIFQCSESCRQEHLFWHFSSPGHNGFLNDVSITFIDKMGPSDPLKFEHFWQ